MLDSHASSKDLLLDNSYRTHLSPQAWIDYIPNYLDTEQASTLMDALIHSQDWEHRSISVFGKDVKQPRLMSWGGELPYRYSGQTLPIRPIPDELKAIWSDIERRYQHTFNHVVLNYYRDGKDHMGMHADDEKELGRNPLIVALSLGVSRLFTLEIKQRRRGRKKEKKRRVLALIENQTLENKNEENKSREQLPIDDRTQYPLGKRYQLMLEHGSLMTMGGDLQHKWRHGVPLSLIHI